MKNIIIAVAVLILLILGFRAFSEKAEAPQDIKVTNNIQVTPPTPVVSPYADEIKITNPVASQIIPSPLMVSGTARGSWYFEASAPVMVKDSNGKILGQGHVEAQGEWMTPEFVPFKGTITFATSTTATGTVIFMNDNPSGDPIRDKAVVIPVSFR